MQCAIEVGKKDGEGQRKVFEACSNLSYLTYLKTNKPECVGGGERCEGSILRWEGSIC